ncbi:hypothetical protein HK413_14325 [Mucilaginibacter sp. S1162]|uniref:Uncharacterized protein n=1 Tax=Mucilaginibacter humi TaxID=2732510 RepID=A0ABX1W3V7_9SPHI|nr:hypothetical protein [Mucilaginibacter humi]NNU34922.1 hypothetical protein [Mucilaginibacter humi]
MPDSFGWCKTAYSIKRSNLLLTADTIDHPTSTAIKLCCKTAANARLYEEANTTKILVENPSLKRAKLWSVKQWLGF